MKKTRAAPPAAHEGSSDDHPPRPSLTTLPPELILLIDDRLLEPYPSPSPRSPIPTADNLAFRYTARRIAAACAPYPSRSLCPCATVPANDKNFRRDNRTRVCFRRRWHRDAVERERAGTSLWRPRACFSCLAAHAFWMFDPVELVWAPTAERRCFGWRKLWKGAPRPGNDYFLRRVAARRRIGRMAGERTEGEQGLGWTEIFLKVWMSVRAVAERVVWVLIKAVWVILYILLRSLEWMGEKVDLLVSWRRIGEAIGRLKSSSLLEAGARPT
ncbi:hypothetical protein NpPPO83_00005974 [Neofusicoccum parvum]|uniref:Uncharacterized protein n=1 Tax=Neofusicoccum parvum TaxID=310453 RepID=A0ACB5RWF2_9PEZI|nr:hypothetical protein NpPPO83_00005974 [Neofusicoccum parvum]